jgi:hypothetical protein
VPATFILITPALLVLMAVSLGLAIHFVFSRKEPTWEVLVMLQGCNAVLRRRGGDCRSEHEDRPNRDGLRD